MPAAAPLAHIRIEPSRGWVSLRLGELWEYRELLYFLTWRDVKVRYKQSLLGAGWAVLQPLLTMMIFTFVFGGFAKVPTDGLPYPIFAFAALLPWQYFAGAVARSGASLVNSANLIAKVYFPRLAIPLAAAVAPLVDFAIAFVILIAMMLFYQIKPTWGIVLLPAFLLLAFLTALGVSLWLAALNVKYRDVGHLIPFLMQAWLYLSPVAYPSSAVPAEWQWLYGLNPMAGVVEGFRWALLGSAAPPRTLVLASSLVVLAVLWSGLVYFQRTEETFADVI